MKSARELTVVPVADEASGAAVERAQIRDGLRYCLWVFLGLRVGLTVLALAGVGLLPTLEPVDVPGWPAHPTTLGWHNVFTAWERFDALWFLRIATAGYGPEDGSAAFYPGFPMAIRGVSFLIGGHPLAAGFVVSHLATFGSMALLYFLTASEFDERVARRTVLYLAVFPTSFFLLAPYSESLFLFLVLLSLWAARRNRWVLAAVAGIGASATRNLGVLLALPLAVEAIQQYRERRQGPRLALGLAAAAASVLGAAGYLLYWQLAHGDALAPVNQQVLWERALEWPFLSVLIATREGLRYIGQYPGGYHLLDWLIVTPALLAAAWVALRTRPVYGVYTWASLIAPLTFTFFPRPYMSVPRFLVVIFPILWAVAVWAGRRRAVHEAFVAWSSALLGVTTVLFLGWYYVF